MKKLIIAIVGLLILVSTASAAEISPTSLLISSDNQIYEYTIQGDFIQSFPIEYPGTYNATDYARDIAADTNGNLFVYNGTFTPYISSYNIESDIWDHFTTPGFTTVNNQSYGGIDFFGDYIFASDMFTYNGGEAKGILVFDKTTGESYRFAEEIEAIDLTIGLNGLLYTLSPGGSPGGRTINIYDPSNQTFIDSIDLTSIFGWTEHRSIAVDRNGDIFIADWDGEIHHITSDGFLVTTTSATCNTLGRDIPCSFFDIDISAMGEIALGTRNGEVIITDTSLSSISKFSVGSDFTFVEFPREEKAQVEIDINANSEENRINLKSSGLVSVVIFTDEGFDAAEIDTNTLGFGPNAAPALQNRIFIKDVDGDGDLDLFVYFYISQTNIACTDQEAVVGGYTYEGRPFEGSDFITVISRCP